MKEPDPVTVSPLLYFDHYSDGGFPWTMSGDSLKAQGFGPQSVLIRKDSSFVDGWVDASTDHADDGGLVLRFLDSDHYYMLAIRDDLALFPKSIANLELYEHNGPGPDAFQPFDAMDLAWPPFTNHRIRFAVTGNVFSVYMDGVLLWTRERSPAFVGGKRFGLRHYGLSFVDRDFYVNFAWRNTGGL